MSSRADDHPGGSQPFDKAGPDRFPVQIGPPDDAGRGVGPVNMPPTAATLARVTRLGTKRTWSNRGRAPVPSVRARPIELYSAQ